MNCEKCGVEATLLDIGSASGRKTWRCGGCGAQWREKNAAAAALGSLGGKARAESLSADQLSEQGAGAAAARWAKEKGCKVIEGTRGIMDGKAFKDA